MARPLKNINWELVEKRMEAGCSAKEIAGAIPCDIDTFYDRFKIEYGASFSEFSAKFYEGGDGNLRFTQYMKALAGNTNMLTLLGRERLGQGTEKESTPPNNDFMALRHENMLLRAELDAYKEVTNADES